MKTWNVEGTIKFLVSANGIKAKTEKAAKEKAEELLGEVMVDWPDRLNDILSASQVSPYEVEIDSVVEE